MSLAGESKCFEFLKSEATFLFAFFELIKRENKRERDMSASSVIDGGQDGGGFLNVNCNCGKRIAVKLFEFDKNKNKIYYTCVDGICGRFLE